MSAIAGVIHLDGAYADRGTQQRLKNAITPFGRDRQDSLDWGGGHFMRSLLRTTPEDALDRQPLLHEEARLLLLFDGRLDNREDLANQLGLDTASLRQLADSDLALRAVMRWGSDAPARFIGDFALACWQPASRRLWLARDLLGTRSLYWHLHGRRLAFSSSARSLLTLPGVEAAVDEGRLHDHFCLLPQRGPASFFKGISRVEPGHVVEFVDGHQISSRCHQSFTNIQTLHLARDDDYVEALDDLLTQVMRSHLRSCTPIASHLSSGFDSSTVTAYAARLLAENGQRLTAYTAIPRPGYSGPVPAGRHADESVAARALALRFANIDHELVNVQALDWLTQTRQINDTMDAPILNPLNSLWYLEINRRAVESGARVVLTGQMGNMTISHQGLQHFAQLINQGRWLDWWREFRHWQRRGQWRTPINLGVIPNLPAAFQLALRRLRGQQRYVLNQYTAMHPMFSARMNTEVRARETHWDMNYLPWKDSRAMRTAVIGRLDLGPHHLHCSAQGMEQRDPTADLRLLRFCLAIPEAQYLRHGQTRWLLQRLMTKILPAEITQAHSKGLQQADWHEHLNRSLPSIRADLQRLRDKPVVASLVDTDSLLASLDDWPTSDWESQAVIHRYRLKLARGMSNAWFVAQLEDDNS